MIQIDRSAIYKHKERNSPVGEERHWSALIGAAVTYYTNRQASKKQERLQNEENNRALAANRAQQGLELDPHADQRAYTDAQLRRYKSSFFGPYASRESKAYDDSMGHLGNVLSGKFLSPESNPYLKNNVEMLQRQLRPMQKNMRDEISSQMRMASGGGAWSSPMIGEYGALLNRQTNDMQDLATKLYYNNYQTELNRMFEAAPTYANLSQLPYTTEAALNANRGGGTQFNIPAPIQPQRIEYNNPYAGLGNSFSSAIGSYYDYKASKEK